MLEEAEANGVAVTRSRATQCCFLAGRPASICRCIKLTSLVEQARFILSMTLPAAGL